MVFNGALKTNLTVNAKQTIVEDGIMIQIDIETMTKLKQTLQSMKPFRIECTKTVSAQVNNLLTQPNDTTITIEWSKEDNYINRGVFSVIDSRPMVGIKSLRLNNTFDYTNETKAIRWVEIYIITLEEDLSERASEGSFNLNKFAEKCSSGACCALAPLLDDLVEVHQAHLLKNKTEQLLSTSEHLSKYSSPFKIGLRININKDQVGYVLGMNERILSEEKFLTSLDNELIQLLHQAISYNMNISLEFIFYIQERFNCNN